MVFKSIKQKVERRPNIGIEIGIEFVKNENRPILVNFINTTESQDNTLLATHYVRQSELNLMFLQNITTSSSQSVIVSPPLVSVGHVTRYDDLIGCWG